MAISVYNFSAPIDPTGFASITGAQLLSLVNGAQYLNDKGGIIYSEDTGATPDVPDATVTTQWKRYFWTRKLAASTVVYFWDDYATSDATLLQWTPITGSSAIPDGSITNDKIADTTIQDVKIVELSYTKLTNLPSGFTPGGTAGGSLTGTYPNPSIADDAVVTSKILAANVTEPKLADSSVSLRTIASGVFTADAAGRAKFANDFVDANKTLLFGGALTANATLNVDWSLGQVFTLNTGTVGGDETLTFSNAKVGQSIVILVTYGTAYATARIRKPTGGIWANGTEPVAALASGQKDLFAFVYDGTNYWGAFRTSCA